MDVFFSLDKKLDVKMSVLDVFMIANSILLSNIHPTNHFRQIYIHCIIISAGCKNGNVSKRTTRITYFSQFFLNDISFVRSKKML